MSMNINSTRSMNDDQGKDKDKDNTILSHHHNTSVGDDSYGYDHNHGLFIPSSTMSTSMTNENTMVGEVLDIEGDCYGGSNNNKIVITATTKSSTTATTATIKSSPSSSVLPLLYVGFISNVLLFLGLLLVVIFNYYDMTGRKREHIAMIIYFVSFGVLLLSTMIELGTDLFFTHRIIKHGRYCYTSEKWNIIISILFIIGVILDIIAFVFWRDMEMEIEKNILMGSAYTYFIMQLVVMYFAVSEQQQQQNTSQNNSDNNNDDDEDDDDDGSTNNTGNNVTKRAAAVAERLNIVANTLFFLGLVLNVGNRHMDKSNSVEEIISKTVEFWLSIVWLVATILYVVADIILLKSHDVL